MNEYEEFDKINKHYTELSDISLPSIYASRIERRLRDRKDDDYVRRGIKYDKKKI